MSISKNVDVIVFSFKKTIKLLILPVLFFSFSATSLAVITGIPSLTLSSNSNVVNNGSVSPSTSLTITASNLSKANASQYYINAGYENPTSGEIGWVLKGPFTTLSQTETISTWGFAVGKYHFQIKGCDTNNACSPYGVDTTLTISQSAPVLTLADASVKGSYTLKYVRTAGVLLGANEGKLESSGITKAEAVANCQFTIASSPSSDILCTWNGSQLISATAVNIPGLNQTTDFTDPIWTAVPVSPTLTLSSNGNNVNNKSISDNSNLTISVTPFVGYVDRYDLSIGYENPTNGNVSWFLKGPFLNSNSQTNSISTWGLSAGKYYFKIRGCTKVGSCASFSNDSISLTITSSSSTSLPPAVVDTTTKANYLYVVTGNILGEITRGSLSNVTKAEALNDCNNQINKNTGVTVVCTWNGEQISASYPNSSDFYSSTPLPVGDPNKVCGDWGEYLYSASSDYTRVSYDDQFKAWLASLTSKNIKYRVTSNSTTSKGMCFQGKQYQCLDNKIIYVPQGSNMGEPSLLARSSSYPSTKNQVNWSSADPLAVESLSIESCAIQTPKQEAVVISLVRGEYVNSQREGTANITIPSKASGKILVLIGESSINWVIANPNNVQVNKILVVNTGTTEKLYVTSTTTQEVLPVNRVTGAISGVSVEKIYVRNAASYWDVHRNDFLPVGSAWRQINTTNNSNYNAQSFGYVFGLGQRGISVTPDNYYYANSACHLSSVVAPVSLTCKDQEAKTSLKVTATSTIKENSNSVAGNSGYGTCLDLKRNLTYLISKDSNTNGEVTKLQNFLKNKGLLSGDSTGNFGALTLSAVKDFQKQNGLNTTGLVGPSTREAIKNISCGSSLDTSKNLKINTDNLKDGVLGQAYREAVSTSGGDSKIRVTISSGLLPPGINFIMPECTAITDPITGVTSSAGCFMPENMILAGTPSATGTYNFTVSITAGTKSTSKQFRIVVNATESANKKNTDKIPTVLSPNGDETLIKGNNYNITWKGIKVDQPPCTSFNGITSCPALARPESYNVELVKSSASCSGAMCSEASSIFIAKDTPHLNYEWTVGTIESSSSLSSISDGQYKIRVCATVWPPYGCDISDNYFKIVSGDTISTNIPTVYSPNGGEIFAQGSKQVITWKDITAKPPVCVPTASMTCPQYVSAFQFSYDLYLVSEPQACLAPAGAACTQALMSPIKLASNIYGSSYSFVVGGINSPIGQIAYGQYRIRVCVNGRVTCDSSDNYFTLSSGSTTNIISLANPTLSPSSPASQFVVGGSSFGIETIRLATSQAGTSATVRELSFVTTGPDAIENITVGGVSVPVMTSTTTVSGLNIPVNSTGVDVPVMVKFSGFQYSTTGGYLTSGVSNVGVTLVSVTASDNSGKVLANATPVSSNKMTLIASKPTVMMASGSVSSSLMLGVENKIGEFTVTADMNGKVSLSKVGLAFAASGFGPILTSIRVANGNTTIPTTSDKSTNINIQFNSPYEIAAGSSVTFSVYAVVSGELLAPTAIPFIRTRLDTSSFLWNDVIGGNTQYTGANLYNFPVNSYNIGGVVQSVKTPLIRSVNPQQLATGKSQKVTLFGENFSKTLYVAITGPGADTGAYPTSVSSDGKYLTFDFPATINVPGNYLIQVLNFGFKAYSTINITLVSNSINKTPTVTLESFSPSTISVGQSSNIGFTSTNASTCYGSGLWNGDLQGTYTPTGGKSTGTMNNPGTYTQTVTCTGQGGSATSVTRTLTVTAVQASAPTATLNLRIMGNNLHWYSTNASSCYYKITFGNTNGDWVKASSVDGKLSLSGIGLDIGTKYTIEAYCKNSDDKAGPTDTVRYTPKVAVEYQTSTVLGASTLCVDITYNLHRGYEDNNVKNLQAFLVSKGLLSDTPSGFYGDKTVEAVKSYQVSKGLPATGMVYDFTRSSIKEDSCN